MSFLLLFPAVSVTPGGIITFRRFRPAPRFPPIDTPWTEARVDFAPVSDTPTPAPPTWQWPPRVPGSPGAPVPPWPWTPNDDDATDFETPWLPGPPPLPPTPTPAPQPPATADASWVLGDPFPLPAIDTDPTHPQAQSVSQAASSGPGWYRLVFVDAAGDTDLTQQPVLFPVEVLMWRPIPDDVAQVCPTYTRHDIDAVGVSAGAAQNVFDDLTDPTVDQVEGLIDNALREIVGRVGLTALELNQYAEMARQTAVWHVAATIEMQKATENASDADGPAKWDQASYVACLNALQGMIPTALRLA